LGAGWVGVGTPEPGLTNAQAWAKYGIAVAGAVAPAGAAPTSRIWGLVAPIPLAETAGGIDRGSEEG
jgi:hypothetical protein